MLLGLPSDLVVLYHCQVEVILLNLLGATCLQVYLMWPAGITLMLVAWISTIYGLWQLIQLHEIKGRRFNRYHELGQYALGKPAPEALLALQQRLQSQKVNLLCSKHCQLPCLEATFSLVCLSNCPGPC